ncbi:MAG: glycosyltransferase family 4 protein [Bacteroidales bacterium]
MKVLLTVRDLNKEKKVGGVGSYYLSLQNHIGSFTNYFFIGKRFKDRTPVVFRLIRDYLNLAKKTKDHDILVTNTSLSINSLRRDAISLIIFRRKGKKTIVFFRGWHQYMVKRIDNNRLIRYFILKTFGKSDAIIVLSREFKEKLRQWGVTKPIYVETTVVDEALVNKYENFQLAKTKKKFNILFLARIEKYKGVFETLDIFRMLKEKYPFISLTIAGDGSKLSMLKEKVFKQNISDITFTGYVAGTEKAKAFASSDLYLFPSYGEGMPNSVLEAMAFGLPIVTRPVGGLMDFFEDNKMGFTSESKDPAAFIGLIEQLIEDSQLCHEISNFNAEYARKHFMATSVAKRLEKIFYEVLSNKAVDGSWQ